MQPHCSYLICATPHDGSTLLSEALKSTGIAGSPEGYFGAFGYSILSYQKENFFQPSCTSPSSMDWNSANYADILADAFGRGTSGNGVFGARMLWSYFDDFVCHLRRIPVYSEVPVVDLLPAVLPNVQYILFTRGNKVQQAISFWKATQRRIWTLSDAPVWELVFNFEAIDRLAQQIVAHEMDWLQYFNACGTQPLIVLYEDLLSRYEETMHHVLQYLQLPVSEQSVFARPQCAGQVDVVAALWGRRYCQIKQRQGFSSLSTHSQEGSDRTFDL
jgi:LPS sulfotransferase NodH